MESCNVDHDVTSMLYLQPIDFAHGHLPAKATHVVCYHCERPVTPEEHAALNPTHPEFIVHVWCLMARLNMSVDRAIKN